MGSEHLNVCHDWWQSYQQRRNLILCPQDGHENIYRTFETHLYRNFVYRLAEKRIKRNFMWKTSPASFHLKCSLWSLHFLCNVVKRFTFLRLRIQQNNWTNNRDWIFFFRPSQATTTDWSKLVVEKFFGQFERELRNFYFVVQPWVSFCFCVRLFMFLTFCPFSSCLIHFIRFNCELQQRWATCQSGVSELWVNFVGFMTKIRKLPNYTSSNNNNTKSGL